MAQKENITFDQLYQTVIYEKLLTLNDNIENFVVLNDVSEFQENDKLIEDDTTYILIKTYGGTKTTLPNLNQSLVACGIIVNTPNGQKWKRILDTLISETNGEWQTISYAGDEKYNPVSYNYFQTLGTPYMLSQVENVGTSTRYIVSVNGNIAYDTSTNYNVFPTYSVLIGADYVDIKNIINHSFSSSPIPETFIPLSSGIAKNEIKGVARTFTISVLIDYEDEAHNLLLTRCFNNDELLNPIPLKIEITNELVIVGNFSVSITANQTRGNYTTATFNFVESSD